MTRDERIKALWSEMDRDQRDRAWADLSDVQRVDAVRAMFDATEVDSSGGNVRPALDGCAA
jgi:hypothetical protein